MLGLAGRGNFSEVPEFGGLNADMGSFGRVLGFRRTPTPGEMGAGGMADELIVVVG